jgi:enoyl-CoA hydratase
MSIGTKLTRRSEGEAVSGDDMAWHRATGALESVLQPTVGAIDGNASGGGCPIALACTFRIASQRSVFGPVELNLGVVQDRPLTDATASGGARQASMSGRRRGG